MTASGAPLREMATPDDAGRPCPFCRFPLKAGIEVVRCRGCHVSYHPDCWSDNAGCAVVGCTGVPASGAERPRRGGESPRETRTGGHGTFTGARAPESGGRSGWMSPGLALAIGVLAVAIIVLAIALSRGDGSGGGPSAGGGQVQSQGVAPGGGSTGAGSGHTAEADAQPIANDLENRREIRDVLYRFHADVLAGDYAGAWALMSRRKQRQKLRDGGYDRWRRAQATLRPYLHPAGLHVAVQALDPRTGVARVMLTGMRWTDPRASCTEWSGITWMKHENGSWRYDPGYSTTTERERLWKPRAAELLGVSC